MDYTSLSDGQQPQSDGQQQPYDPAQAQAYAAYYAASAYYNQQYYPQDYSSSSAAPNPNIYYADPQAPPEAAAPPADAAQIHHPAEQAAAGLNPAAAAALSQISQLTGSIDAAERMMAAGMHGRPHYQQYAHPLSIHGPVVGVTHRGGGRRGGGPPRGRGGNRGRIGQRPFGRDGGGPPPFRGRGHGRMSRGRGRRPQNFDPDLQQQHITAATTSEPLISAAAHAQGRPLFAPKAPQKSILPVAWCDVCRVDCNSLEILEQHKNGKRHKRTVQRIQEIQAQQNIISTELQFNTAAKPDLFIQGEYGNKLTNDGPSSIYVTNRTIPSSAGGTEADQGLASSGHIGEVNKDVGSSMQVPVTQESIEGFVASENKLQEMETANQCQVPEGQSGPVSDIANTGIVLTDALQDEPLPIDGFNKKRRIPNYDRDDRWHGSKQKMMRVGRGGKPFRSFERTHNRPFERSKGPRDRRPRVCTVCNVMCDTLRVFECHLSGKKHISRIKRTQGHGSVYGPISVYIPPNQPTAYPSKGPEPLFYGLQSLETLQQEAALRQEMLQQGAHGVDSQQMEAVAVEQCFQVEGLRETEGAAGESEVKQSIEQPEVGHPTDPIDDEQVVAMSDPDGQSSLNDPDWGEADNSAPHNGDLMDSTDLPIAADVTLPEHAAFNEPEIIVPGLDANSEMPLSKSE